MRCGCEHGRTEEDAAFLAFARAAGGDLDLLADLHDREPSAAVVAALQSGPVAEQLGLHLYDSDSSAALQAFDKVIASLPRPVDEATLDELASGYADVYLRFTFRAAPAESVWMSEDNLERQAPMFEVREIYRRHGLRVTDWANRPDDHLVLELRFLAHLFGKARQPGELAPAAEFLDFHLLRWIDQFAAKLVRAGAPDWYAALSVLTTCYLKALRNHLGELTGIAPPSDEALAAAANRTASYSQDETGPYLPGAEPSW